MSKFDASKHTHGHKHIRHVGVFLWCLKGVLPAFMHKWLKWHCHVFLDFLSSPTLGGWVTLVKAEIKLKKKKEIKVDFFFGCLLFQIIFNRPDVQGYKSKECYRFYCIAQTKTHLTLRINNTVQTRKIKHCTNTDRPPCLYEMTKPEGV